MTNTTSTQKDACHSGHIPSTVIARRAETTARRANSSVSLFLGCAFTLLLAGCAVGPNYQRPKVNAPAEFRGAEGASQQASIADLPWWDVFKDEQLKTLVQTALANNYDLAIAVTRIEQSRQIAAQARAQYFPAAGYAVQASEGKNEFGPVDPSASGGSSKGALIALASAAWEPDIWGRIRRLNESARAQYLATEEARRGVMLSLVSDVAQAYFQLLDLDLQLEIAKQTTDSFGQTLNLFTQRLEGGVATKLDTSRAAAAQATAAASYRRARTTDCADREPDQRIAGSEPSRDNA